ncbi:DUF6461 domain-containing protein [Dactylosporangium sp. NPDC051541]|uniref:DUF6461 domain-containing protein n=1 Tax=Dactylosporangium sp. NPDC051541 TaxID=3363977 RepID=UPI00378D42CF
MAGGGYAWFTEDLALGLNFCLTYVRGVGPDAVLARVGGGKPVAVESAELVGRAQDVVADLEAGDAELALVAATAVGDWTVLFEPNGYLATYDSVVQALSARGELVSLYHNESTTPSFTWARDGSVVERAELDGDFQERTLARMEELSGVRLTAGLLRAAVFRCVAVPYPDPAFSTPSRKTLAAARRALRAFAADPDRSELLDVLWDERGVRDPRLRATGHLGAMLFTSASEAFRLLAGCDDAQLRAVVRWGRERVRAAAAGPIEPLPSEPLAAALHVVDLVAEVLGGRYDLMTDELRRALGGREPGQ